MQLTALVVNVLVHVPACAQGLLCCLCMPLRGAWLHLLPSLLLCSWGGRRDPPCALSKQTCCCSPLANPISYIFPKSSSRCQGHVPKDMVKRFGNGVAGCCSLERPCGCQQTASAASCLTWVAPPHWASPSPSCWPFPAAFLHCPECAAEPHLRPRCCNWKTGERWSCPVSLEGSGPSPRSRRKLQWLVPGWLARKRNKPPKS